MKKVNLIILMVSIIITHVNSQSIDKDLLSGNWFLVNSNVKNSDTLIFIRTQIDSSFVKWSFGKNDSLQVSEGYIFDFEKVKKGKNDGVIVGTNFRCEYKWFVDTQKNKLCVQKLARQINTGRNKSKNSLIKQPDEYSSIEKYSCPELKEESMKLIKDN